MKGIVPVILIAISVGAFFYYISPGYESVMSLQAQNKNLDEAVEASLELDRVKSDLEDRYNSISTADLRRLKKFLPERVDDVRLILDVTTLAEDLGIDLRDVQISEEVESNNRREQEKVDGVETLILSFNFESTYADFLDLLLDLESSLRVIDVVELSFFSIEDSNLLDFSVTIKTYWLN